jgi:hypothetical protein
MRNTLPPREQLMPAAAKLFAQTGVVKLWREELASDAPQINERLYFEMGTAAFRVDVAAGQAIGLVTPEALEYPHILANTYTLFALLLLLRSRGLYHLHAAAALSPRDELWLICGAPRAGKTTLVTALGLAGWRPISDDSLLISFDGEMTRLIAFKKYFHVGNDVLQRWHGLHAATQPHHYLGRTCITGLEFFGTQDLANTSFGQVDHLAIPNIIPEAVSRHAPLTRSQALLRLAEQSAFFQLWRSHTVHQWKCLNELAGTAACHQLFLGSDILEYPHKVAALLN